MIDDSLAQDIVYCVNMLPGYAYYVVETNEVIDWPWYMGNFMNSSLGLTYIYLGEI